MRRRELLALASLVGASPIENAVAQGGDWPTRSVRLVVSFPPGGSIDTVFRLVTAGMTASLGQSVYIDNKPGVVGTLGNEHVARSQPDGYTLLGTNTASYTTTVKLVKVRYDALKDLPPVSLFASSEQVFVTGRRSKYSTLADALKWARANPGAGSVGIIGKGTQDHIAAESLRREHDLNWIYIPYNGTAPIITALVGGDLQLGCMAMSVALPQIESGQLVPLAMAGTKPSPFLPKVPIAGLPLHVSDYIYALASPAGVPRERVHMIYKALQRTVASDTVTSDFRTRALIPMDLGPDEAMRTLADQTAAIAPLLASMDLRIE